ncbi:MAG: PEP-CTERM sorting domain-containing protein [Merismopedia sp. SIO2A8]|nr:PEP-CTERM sorting domain-containing protein [Symploca sp. SIO2B6]NET47363.1 PEP-CTERM sorting domain-containing protein [Merismopedia sp. SIO2A8]
MVNSNLVKKLSVATAGAAFMALGTMGSAQATGLIYEGTLFDGSTETETLELENDFFNFDFPGWDFWGFKGNAGETATVTVSKLISEFEPWLCVWFFTEEYTSEFADIFSDSTTFSLNTFMVADTIGSEATFTLANTGFYAIGLTSLYSYNPTTQPLEYSISLQGAGGQAPTPTSVPEPASLLGLMVVGILGAGCVLKRGHATC